jgi:hypothetical protein
MTSIQHILRITACGLTLCAQLASAEGTGMQRAADGTVQAVTAPAKIVEGVNEETNRNGPVAGAVVGTTRGAVNAAGEVIEGGADVGIGVVETGVDVVKSVLRPVVGE